MWYDKRSMTLLFFVGAFIAAIGIGVAAKIDRPTGGILLCFGVVALVIGFMGLRFNLAAQQVLSRKKK